MGGSWIVFFRPISVAAWWASIHQDVQVVELEDIGMAVGCAYDLALRCRRLLCVSLTVR